MRDTPRYSNALLSSFFFWGGGRGVITSWLRSHQCLGLKKKKKKRLADRWVSGDPIPIHLLAKLLHYSSGLGAVNMHLYLLGLPFFTFFRCFLSRAVKVLPVCLSVFVSE